MPRVFVAAPRTVCDSSLPVRQRCLDASPIKRSLSMLIPRFLKLFPRQPRTFRRHSPTVSRQSRTAFLPRLEGLEDRTVLTFLPPVSYPAGTSPHGVAVGDFNSDGRMDMAVAVGVAGRWQRWLIRTMH